MHRFLLFATLVCLPGPLPAQDARDLITRMVATEDAAALHRQHFQYIAVERSERTGGHLWKECVAETTSGKIRLLLEEDGQPLSRDRDAAERVRLAGIIRDPTAFLAAESAKKNDDDKAHAMLDLLPKAFVVENPRPEGELIRMDFRPNPDYQPQSTQEKVIHAMSGSMTLNSQAMRLHELQARLPQDVSVGFGLATIHAGSSFAMRRDHVTGPEWKTALVDSDINGKAIFFKTLGKKEHVERSAIRLIPFETTIAEAVAMVEK